MEATELPPPLLNKVETILTADRVAGASASSDSLMCDAQQISIEIVKDEQREHFEINESSADPEVWGVCTDLMHQVVLKKARSRKNQS